MEKNENLTRNKTISTPTPKNQKNKEELIHKANKDDMTYSKAQVGMCAVHDVHDVHTAAQLGLEQKYVP
jgi:hypothetical protein